MARVGRNLLMLLLAAAVVVALISPDLPDPLSVPHRHGHAVAVPVPTITAVLFAPPVPLAVALFERGALHAILQPRTLSVVQIC